MQIDLQYGIGNACTRACLLFDPAQVAWEDHGKKGREEYTFLKNTGLPAPFQTLFIKRLALRKADGHDLMLSCKLHPIRYTPLFLGYSQAAYWNYYVYGMLPNLIELGDIFENRLVDHSITISRHLIAVILYNIWIVFEEINKRGFVYPDLCYLNIAYIPKRKGAMLIDMDSCIPLKAPLQHNKFNQAWWVLSEYLGLSDTNILNTTILISLGLVLCKALGELESGVSKNLATTTLAAKPDDQRLLFEIFEQGDKAAFQATYLTPVQYNTQIDFIFQSWLSIVSDLRAGKTIPWITTRGFILRMLNLTGPQAWVHYLENDVIRYKPLSLKP